MKNLSNKDSASLNSQESCEDRQVSSLPYSYNLNPECNMLLDIKHDK